MFTSIPSLFVYAKNGTPAFRELDRANGQGLYRARIAGNGGASTSEDPSPNACRYGAPEKVVETMLQNVPEAAHAVDSLGYLPIHAACRYSGPQKVVEMLFDSCPEATRMKAKDSEATPLHIACSQSESSVEGLIDRDPVALEMVNANGRTPLHRDCHNACLSPRMLKIYPQALGAKDDKGRSPLHLASRFHPSMDGLFPGDRYVASSMLAPGS
jgi:ankyrin repeat protein